MYVFLFAYLTDLLYFNLKFIWRMIRAIVVVTVWNWMWNYLRLNNQSIYITIIDGEIDVFCE